MKKEHNIKILRTLLLGVIVVGFQNGQIYSDVLGEDLAWSRISDRIEMTKSYAASATATTGEKSPSSPVFGTAGDWYDMALENAMLWSSDVQPVAIFNTDTLVTDGTCRGWGYSFYSESIDSVFYVQIADAEVQFGQSQPPFFTAPISGSWVDTYEVIILAEANGGSSYRGSNTGVLIQAFLAGQLYDPCISNSYFWTVGYTSESSSELDIFVRGTQATMLGYHSECQGNNVSADWAYQTVEQKALYWSGDASLFRIESLGPANELGQSSGWAFEFLSRDLGNKRLYHTCDDSTYTDRTTGIIGGWLPRVAGGGWIDSEDALVCAESNGGSEFRGEHPLCNVTATMMSSATSPFVEHLWTVHYDDIYGEQLYVLVGTEAGNFKGTFNKNRNIDSLFTSDLLLSEAQAAASSWSEDAYLFGLMSPEPLSFPRKGTSTAWAYLYYSTQKNEAVSVTVQAADGGPRIALESFSDPWQPGEITAGWLESDSIVTIAGQAGGDGVGGGIEEPVVEAILAKGVYAPQLARTVWLVSYHSSCQSGSFYLDAYTGDILDGGLDIEGEEENSPRLPSSVELLQNFPNPFNPSTVISYNVSEAGGADVTLRIYDIHGRFIKTLVDEVKGAGHHFVQWNGKNESGERVSSGIYLMRLDSGNTNCVRKMILVK
jgi:hypothetical protein